VAVILQKCENTKVNNLFMRLTIILEPGLRPPFDFHWGSYLSTQRSWTSWFRLLAFMCR